MRLTRALSLALAFSTATFSNPLAPAASGPEPARGADIGWLSQLESNGQIFRDSKGTPTNGLDLLKGVGVNSVRLRVWVNPADGWCGKNDVVKMAKRAKDKGFRVMIDFHYSDSWADPGKQNKPAAWSSHNLDQLKADVASHTTEILKALKDSGVTPEWVQVGNETNDGMLWEEGRASKNMAGFAALVLSGSKAVKATFPNAKVIVHISNGYDNTLFRWIFDGLQSNGAQWDVVGMSIYPDTATWRTTETQVLSNMRDMVSHYGKDVMISEIGIEWWDVDSSYALIKKLMADVSALPNNRGLGVFYWEPLAPSGWNGYQKGTLDNSGKLTKALDAFKELMPSSTSPRASIHLAPTRGDAHDAIGRIEPPSPSNRIDLSPTFRSP